MNAARIASAKGAEQFLLVSSVGANVNSGNFYLKLKGEIEQEIRKLTIPSVSIFRPSVLLGKRDEFRVFERFGQVTIQLLSPLIPERYRGINAETVARAMLAASKQGRQGVHIYHFKEIRELAGGRKL